MSAHLKRKRGDGADGANRTHESRKMVATAACTACRKQKIKCDMPSEAPPCSRCQRRGLACVLHTATLRNGVTTDHRQVSLLSDDVASLYATLQAVCGRLDMEPPRPLRSTHDGSPENGNSAQSAIDDAEVYELSAPASPSALQAPIHPYLSSAHEKQDSALTNGGGNHAAAAERPARGKTSSERQDLVSKGLLTAEIAELLVQRYLLHFDRFLYGIARHYNNAAEVRTASPTLLAAMCAVSAFHDLDHKDVFGVCYKEYRALVSASLFDKRGIEYIRALCIGTFWLLDSSRILLSDAVRRAADCRLHSHFRRLRTAATSPRGGTSTSPASVATAAAAAASVVEKQGAVGNKSDENNEDDARDKIRLWYLLFISDRHLTILHNRDSLIWQEKDAIDNRDMFLANDANGGVASETSNLDVRLMSQVSLLVIMGHIRDVIGGSEQGKPIPKSFGVQFSHFAHELDQWYDKFVPSFEPDQHIGTFPLAGLKMHYQYARLYLAHHIFRGLAPGQPIAAHFLPQALAARSAALAVFAVVLEDEAFGANIVGMPVYFHVMISFAGHFLLSEVVMKHREQLGIVAAEGPLGQVDQDLGRVAAVLTLLARSARAVPRQHPIARAVAGLTRRLEECTAALGTGSILVDSPFQSLHHHQAPTGDAGVGAGPGIAGGGGGGAAAPFMTGLSGGHIDVRQPMADTMIFPSSTSALDFGAMGGLSEDLLYPDFGDFDMVFAEPHAHFGPRS
ncbi:hypothetical protein Micbo1qcDRAFT_221405 [Microdochium bolleyi]|uniref:Zn(2)-C6 fungal-type domain-containing protein n=1 Tax=Microdochium bolleyi TaxID=196109 RepID=A0A136JCP5_9PEZI|nr:hypothetical protein Micbo1qcDRAFT_221405 [Microdochium bolleyi]